jgi:hypothetical protein
VSRTDDANGRIAVVPRAATDAGGGYPAESAEGEGCAPNSSITPISPREQSGEWPTHQERPADEGERARLIAEIARLIREPEMPEATRVAGLTLIGWLARRRPEEPPHAVGVEQARNSERGSRAARAKAR